MINFIPSNVNKGTKSIDTLHNLHIANWLKHKYGNRVCPTDASHESVCKIDISNESGSWLTIEKSCCDITKAFLERLSQGQLEYLQGE